MKKKQEVTDNPTKKFNVVSIVSFVVSMIGLFIASLPCGLISVITGIIGLVKFNEDAEKGRWMAITGLCLGILEIVLGVTLTILLSAGEIQVDMPI